MTFPSYRPPHWCYYRRLQGSSKQTKMTMNWIERCRCGRIVQVDMKAQDDGTIAMKKHWFNRDGGLERITGNKQNSSPNQSNV